MAMIEVGKRKIGEGCAPFVIAEVGINHNGELEKAFQMIRVAKACGADAVKFQTFKAKEFVASEDQMFTYKSQGKEVTESMLKMFERYEFSEEEWGQIKTRCKEEDIKFMSTPQNVGDYKLLLKLGVDILKVGSDDFTNVTLIKEYKKSGLPILLSCGMADLAEIFTTLDEVGGLDGYPIVLLLCTSQYPTPTEDVNISKLVSLRQSFPNLILGFSDHSQGDLAAIMAVALGAKVFEKHFTLGHDLPGPDHWFSEDPENLKQWIDSIRAAHVAYGNPLLRPTQGEKENKLEFRRFIVAKKPIQQGEVFSETNLEMKRVRGGGFFHPIMLPKLVGKESNRTYSPGEPIQI